MAKEKKRRGRGEGSIEQLPSGRFRVVVSAGTDGDGKRRKLTATFDLKKDALDWRDEELRKLRRGASPGAGKVTVGGWLDEWLEQKKAKVEPGTWKWYEQR